MTTSTTKLIYEKTWCRYGCPHELIIDYGSQFINILVHDLTNQYVVVHKKNAPYYPHVNGLAEFMSKIS